MRALNSNLNVPWVCALCWVRNPIIRTVPPALLHGHHGRLVRNRLFTQEPPTLEDVPLGIGGQSPDVGAPASGDGLVHLAPGQIRCQGILRHTPCEWRRIVDVHAEGGSGGPEVVAPQAPHRVPDRHVQLIQSQVARLGERDQRSAGRYEGLQSLHARVAEPRCGNRGGCRSGPRGPRPSCPSSPPGG